MLFLIAVLVVKDGFECLGSFDRNIYNSGVVEQTLAGSAANKQQIILDAQTSLLSYQNFCSSSAPTLISPAGGDSTAGETSGSCYPSNRLCGTFCDASPYPSICRNPDSFAQTASAPSTCVPNTNTGINYSFPDRPNCTATSTPPTSFPYLDAPDADVTPPPAVSSFSDPPFSRFDSMTATLVS